MFSELKETLNTLLLKSELNTSYLIGLGSLAVVVFVSNRFYFAGGVCSSKRRLEGQTAIVTGANTGIGYETALDLAKRGARVILACRDAQKANEAANRIRKKSGNGNVIVELVDLASFDSIRKFSQRIEENEPRLDILINNAAVFGCPKWHTKDGFEMHFGVNHLGHFLLTNLLLNKIKASAPSRIVNVSARLHEKMSNINWDDLNWEKAYDPIDAYSQSKLCNVLFTRELARRLKDANVTSVSLHPGVIRTEIGRYLPESYGWFLYGLVKLFSLPFYYWFFKSAKQGAQTTIYCAIHEDVVQHNGCYFTDCKVKSKVPSQAFSEEDARRLWDLSEKLTELK